MAYTTIDDPTAFFQSKLYTGTGSSHAITGVGFAPNWVWLKRRNSSAAHYVWDTVRGAAVQLYPASASSEDADQTNGLSAFGSDGFTLGSDAGPNANSGTYVAWNWKAETSFSNDASSTSIGSIDSAGSVNTTAGFSIIGYTGTGSAGTIAHGLGVKPAMIIFKNRERSVNWLVYHKDIAATKFLYLNVTDAEGTDSGHFNDTEPTSTVFSVGGANGTNYSGENLIAYCFAEKQGYSKFGSYTGNGSSSGTFCYTGFSPAMIICKRTDGAGNDWRIIDNKRDFFNVSDARLKPNTSAAEDTNTQLDFTSNGFKFRASAGDLNGTSTYIYMAFASNPLVTSSGVPATAR